MTNEGKIGQTSKERKVKKRKGREYKNSIIVSIVSDPLIHLVTIMLHFDFFSESCVNLLKKSENFPIVPSFVVFFYLNMYL